MENGKQGAFAMIDTNLGFTQVGLTKREYFAGLAMQGLLTRVPKRHGGETDLGVDEEKRIVFESVSIADALLAELEKTKEE
jgi:hypothetical protein